MEKLIELESTVIFMDYGVINNTYFKSIGYVIKYISFLLFRKLYFNIYK